MRWRLVNLAAATSMLLCVAACVLWLRSYVTVDGWTWSDGVRVPTAGYHVAWRSALLSEHGSIYFIRDRSMGASAYSRRLLPGEASFLPRLDASHSWLGGGYQGRIGYPLIASVASGPPVVLTRVWAVPLWLVVFVSGVMPFWWARKRRRLRRLSKQGRCPACGYDLRASRERCPECGAVPGATPRTAA